VENPETGEPEIGDAGADAQIVPGRGVVVTKAKADELPEDLARVSVEFFGADGRHGQDYTLYYNNIRDNAAKRVAAYLAGR
ncbi:MAG: hypothetical protein IJR68_12645, partial [Fretibacterium sp.]|nr:hypothetical protein [Fretibacterium sp.]